MRILQPWKTPRRGHAPVCTNFQATLLSMDLYMQWHVKVLRQWERRDWVSP